MSIQLIVEFTFNNDILYFEIMKFDVLSTRFSVNILCYVNRRLILALCFWTQTRVVINLCTVYIFCESLFTFHLEVTKIQNVAFRNN